MKSVAGSMARSARVASGPGGRSFGIRPSHNWAAAAATATPTCVAAKASAAPCADSRRVEARLPRPMPSRKLASMVENAARLLPSAWLSIRAHSTS